MAIRYIHVDVNQFIVTSSMSGKGYVFPSCLSGTGWTQWCGGGALHGGAVWGGVGRRHSEMSIGWSTSSMDGEGYVFPSCLSGTRWALGRYSELRMEYLDVVQPSPLDEVTGQSIYPSLAMKSVIFEINRPKRREKKRMLFRTFITYSQKNFALCFHV